MKPLHEHPQLALLFDSARRGIFERVARRPRSARELVDDLGLGPMEVTRRLRELVAAGLVARERSGSRVRYRLDDAGMARLGRALEAAWSASLAHAFAMATTLAPRRDR